MPIHVPLGNDRVAAGKAGSSVACRLYDRAVLSFDSCLQDGIVPGQGALHRLGKFFPETGAILQVGE